MTIKIYLTQNKVFLALIFFALTVLTSCGEPDDRPLDSSGNTSIKRISKASVYNTNEMTIRINEPTIFTIQTRRGSTATDIIFYVPEIFEGRLQIQVRAPLLGVKISLSDPAGRTVVPDNDPETIIVPSKVQKKTDLGSLIMLPEQYDPSAGTWHLHISYQSATGSELIILTANLVERFSVNLISSQNKVYAGQPIILNVLVMDYGVAIPSLSPRINISHNDVAIGSLAASEHAMSSSGIRFSNEPGVYMASYTPIIPGKYSFTAEVEVVGKVCMTLKSANLIVDVEERQVILHQLTATTVLGYGDCTRAINFLVKIGVKEPGMYTVSLFLEGKDGKEIELSATQSTKSAAVLSYTIPLKAAKARALCGTILDEVRQIDVLRFNSANITLLGRYCYEHINPKISLENLCK